MSKKSTELGVGKKVLASALSAAMVVAFAPAVAMAEGTGNGDEASAATQSSNDEQIAGTVVTTAEALKTAVEAGGEVVLGASIVLNDAVVIPQDKTVTLDLADYVLSRQNTVILNKGTLTIRASGTGKISSTKYVAVAVGDNSKTTIESGTFESVEGAVITSYATGATIDINGGSFAASDNAVVAGNGNKTNPTQEGNPERVVPNTININGGTFNGGIKSSGYVACGIYAPWKDNINVSGGIFNITGGAGIVARAGRVSVTGGEFNVTGNTTGKVGDSRVVVPCSTVVFDEEANYPALANDSSVELKGGTFSSEDSVISTVPSADSAVKRVQISGGTFADIASAVKYAADNATLKMGANATASLTIPAEKSITLDLNGKTLTNVAGQHTITNNGILVITGKGTIDNVSHGKASIENAVGATCNILSGTITRSQEKGASTTDSGGNSFYYIENYGTMTIGAQGASNDEVNVTSNGHFSSLVHNGWYDGTKNTTKSIATLTVNSGYFQGGINTLKNDDFGKIVVNGGKAVNATQYAVFNVNEAEIHGGEFESTTMAAVWNGAYDDEGDKGVLHITGGSFKSAGSNDVSETNLGAVPVTVLTGGIYSTDVSNFIDKKTVAEYKMLDGTYIVSAEVPAHTGNGNAYSGPVDGVYTEYVYSSGGGSVTPVDPKPEPTPTPEPAAPGTNVSGTDASGNTVEATVTGNEKVELPDGTEAAGSVEYKGTTGSSEPASSADIPASVTDSSGTVYAVTKIADNAFSGQSQLKSVSIPETVVEVGSNAFAGTGIESVRLPAATSTLGAGAFKGCASLKTADISAAALTSIPADAFNGAAISSIDIPGSVKTIGARAFKGTKLKSVESKAKTVGKGAFADCKSLRKLSVPKAKTVGASAFAGCSSLKTASLPAAVTIGARAFEEAPKLMVLRTGRSLKGIGPRGLQGSGVRTLKVESKKLTKKGVRDSLRGSKVTKVEVAVTGSKKTQDSYVSKYREMFKKANSGKSVKVVKAKKTTK